MKFAEEFCTKLDEIKCSYKRETTQDGKEVVSLGLAGENFTGLHFCVLFDNPVSAQIKCFHVCRFPEDKNLLMLQVVNQLNNKFRWTTFSAASSGAVSVAVDMEATEDTAPDVLFHYLGRISSIVDAAYPVLMKALYV